MRQILSVTEQERYAKSLDLLKVLTKSHDDLQVGLDWLHKRGHAKLSLEEERLLWYLLRRAINTSRQESAEEIAKWLLKASPELSHPEIIDALLVEVLLYQGDLMRADQVLKRYPLARLREESSPLYFVYGCYLVFIEGISAALDHFGKLLDIAFPRSWVLGAHFLAGKIHMTSAGWFARSFVYERRALYEQLRLFWHAARDQEKCDYWKNLLIKEEEG
jgi:serine/threonine-protein kinase